MINSKTIALFILVAMTALAMNIVVDRDNNEPALPLTNDPDLYMVNATIRQFDETGVLQHRISAQRFTHFPLTDTTTLKTPHMRIFPSTEQTPWNINSDNGRLLAKSAYRDDVVELWDRVFASQKDQQGRMVEIKTEALTVYPGRDYAETNTQVTIEGDGGTTTAAGMQAYFDTRRFIFYSSPKKRVTTVLTAAQNQDSDA